LNASTAAALAAVLTLILAPSAGAHLLPRPEREPGQAKADWIRAGQVANVRHARGAVRFLERRLNGKAVQRGLYGRAARELDWHRKSLVWSSRELSSTWLGAVELVGVYYGPGIRAWLRSCSQATSEGGWGRWVPNTQGSGAGGWLQFMSGTFWSVIDDAIARARAAGMVVPSSARSWYSPLGQALAGDEMIRDGRRREWSGWAC
jgi:hypothetical protein